MSIPASLTISKLRYLETEDSLTAGKFVAPQDIDEKPSNSLHAFTNGSWLDIKISGMIVAVVICILSLLGLTSALLGWWGRYLNINNPSLSVELMAGY
jgi:concentrative nucleoside transporter, CNT family